MIFAGPFAMARPSRPAKESALVVAAAAALDGQHSRARLAEIVAARVVERALCAIDDDLLGLTARLEAHWTDPIATLATSPDIDVAGLILAERTRALADRGGRYPTREEATVERQKVAARLTGRLAKRYSRHLKKLP